LVYAHREDTPDHLAYREWLESIVSGVNYLVRFDDNYPGRF